MPALNAALPRACRAIYRWIIARSVRRGRDGTSSRVHRGGSNARSRQLEGGGRKTSGRRRARSGTTIASGGGVNSANADVSGRAPCVRRPWRRASRSFPADFVCGARNGARAAGGRAKRRPLSFSCLLRPSIIDTRPNCSYHDCVLSLHFRPNIYKKSRLIYCAAANRAEPRHRAWAPPSNFPRHQRKVMYSRSLVPSMCDAVRGAAPLPGAREPYIGRSLRSEHPSDAPRCLTGRS